MIEKILFPLKLNNEAVSGTFFTTEDLLLKDQVYTLKNTFPEILEPIHLTLKSKGMNPILYNYSFTNGKIISSILTKLHIIKLEFNNQNDMFFSVYDNKTNKRVSYYNVKDLVHYTSMNNLSIFFKSSLENDTKNIMVSMFNIIKDLLLNRFFEK